MSGFQWDGLIFRFSQWRNPERRCRFYLAASEKNTVLPGSGFHKV